MYMCVTVHFGPQTNAMDVDYFFLFVAVYGVDS